MPDSATDLTALRQRIALVEGQRQTHMAELVPFGDGAIDACLGGGIERGRLHEVFALDAGDASSAAGFVAMVVRRLGATGAHGAVLWLRQEGAHGECGALHMPGLIELGIGRGDMVIGVLPDALALLRVAADVARCAEVAVVVIELWRNPRDLDLTATRRLAVAAEASGVTALMLRIAAEPGPSAAATRWAIGAAPAVPLEANAPGFATLAVELMRQRGGRAGGRWIVEWDRDQSIFRAPGDIARRAGPNEAPLSRPVAAAAAGGAGGA